MLKVMRKYLVNVDGATAIEYAMIAGFISILIVLGVTAIGTTISAQFFGPVTGAL